MRAGWTAQTCRQSSCLENPRNRTAWWAAVYGVAQSRTRLNLKGVQPPLPFGERTRDCSPGHAGKEGPHAGLCGRCTGVAVPLRVVPSPTGSAARKQAVLRRSGQPRIGTGRGRGAPGPRTTETSRLGSCGKSRPEWKGQRTDRPTWELAPVLWAGSGAPPAFRWSLLYFFPLNTMAS